MAKGVGEAQAFSLSVRGLQFDALGAGPEGGDLVLLLHGFPQFADSWAGVMMPLATGGFRVVAVSQRGYSPEARPLEVEAYALREFVEDVLGFADALGAERFHLVGHDWGGAVAWAVAAQHPGRLRSLAVLSTPHLDAFAKALAHNADQKVKSAYMALFRAPGHAAEKMLLAFDAKVLRGIYQGKPPSAQVERNVQRLQQDGALTAALNWYRANTFELGLGPVKVPTTYLWGDKDIALGEAAAMDTRTYVQAEYRFVRLTGVSHWMVDEVPEQVSRLLLEHLRANAE